jgi:subtilisin family serine protease
LAVRRGVSVVAAAGNERDGDPLEFPAGFPHVISVAALDAGDAPAVFSSSGRTVDVAAPGQDVLTAVPAGFDPDGTPDGFASLSGTSFAAPMVTAAAVWLRAARPGLSADQVAALLCDSARDLAERGWDARTGCGALDLAAALGGRAPRPDRLEPNDDVMWVDGRVLRPAAPFVWRGGRRVTMSASVTSAEDRVDVYRARIPAGSRARVSVTAPRGVVLRVLGSAALDVADRSALIGQRRSAGQVDIANRASVARTTFVAVLHDRRRARTRTIAYRLSIRRT